MVSPDLPTTAGQVLVVGFPGTEPFVPVARALRSGELGGFILFRRNIEDVAQVADLVSQLTREAPGDRPALVAVDQEGGRVARLGAPVVRLPPMARLGRHGDPTLTLRMARTLAAQLRTLGFTMDFAPVLDVDTNPENPVIGDRAFSSSPSAVVEHGLAFARGMAAGGLLSCGKHFPGHGDTDLDSHLALPRLRHGRERLDEVELVPFRAARGVLPAIMTAHVVFDALDPDVPATLSRRVITGLLREELGYDGVIVSDDLEMRAVRDRWGVADSAVAAIDAGCDVLLVCSELDAWKAAHEALVRRAEKVESFRLRLEDAARRSLALRRAVRSTPVTDRETLTAALRTEDAEALGRVLAEL